MARTAINEMTFGIEAEVICRLSQADLAAHIERIAGVPCAAESYNHLTRRHWKVVRDGSVALGWEVVSPVLQGAAGLDAVRRVMDALNMVATADSTCGFHVHFALPGMDLGFMKNFSKMWIKWERAIDGFVAEGRRESRAYYCRSNIQGTVEGMMDRIGRAGSIDALGRIMNPNGDRYFKLNLQSFWRHGTMEIRQLEGTTDASKVLAWINMIAEMVGTAATVKSVGKARETEAGALRKAFISRRSRPVAAALRRAATANGLPC